MDSIPMNSKYAKTSDPRRLYCYSILQIKQT